MASDIWLRTILIVRKETRCRHIGYSYRLTARVHLYAPSHRQDNTVLCYTSRGALAGTRNSSMGPPHEESIRRPIAPWANALPLSYVPLRAGRMTLCCVVPASVRRIWFIHISWRKILHRSVSTVSVFWQFATFWWSAITVKQGKIYLVEEMWWNYLDATPH